ncbi:MAG: SPASM domain-containing protein [Deltaproteobacteria bacterium]|nr:SPASM domain-containing protein [Deltaproteobacteria bacterium]
MELKAPIRIYWDLTPAPLARAPDPLPICAEILASRALSLHLYDGGALLGPACRTALEALVGKAVAVTLSASAAAVAGSAGELRGLGVREVLVCAASVEELRPFAAADWWRDVLDVPLGVSFRVGSDNWRELPELLSFCDAEGVSQVVFPIPRARGGAPESYPDASARELLALTLPVADQRPRVRLTIHDPFLWKVFYPERPFPEGGCQAANTMLYIAPDAAVHPCPALPHPLGRLGEDSLAEIFGGERKRAVRQRLGTPPAECRPCAALPHCLGGCRGRGYSHGSSWEVADPACR